MLTQADYAAAIAEGAAAPAPVPSGSDADAVAAATREGSALSGAARNPIDAQSTSSGCTFGTSPAASGAVFMALAALLGGLARLRRRCGSGR